MDYYIYEHFRNINSAFGRVSKDMRAVMRKTRKLNNAVATLMLVTSVYTVMYEIRAKEQEARIREYEAHVAKLMEEIEELKLAKGV